MSDQPIVNEEFRFSKVVFFGRSLSEYINMFDLHLGEMTGLSVFDCASGPAAFAFEAAAHGISVTACDPMYAHTLPDLRVIVDAHAEAVRSRQVEMMDLFHPEVVSVGERRKAMEVFLNDFESGKKDGRYVAGTLPALPFPDQSFDMALQGNLLFLYSDVASGGMLESSPFDYEFHKRSVFELMRLVKRDLRIYPLQAPRVSSHKYLEPLMTECRNAGFEAEVLPVAERDIIGSEFMLRISR